jgi:hypothetical protein
MGESKAIGRSGMALMNPLAEVEKETALVRAVSLYPSWRAARQHRLSG